MFEKMTTEQIRKVQVAAQQEISRREMEATIASMRDKIVFEGVEGSCTCHRCLEGRQACGMDVTAVSVQEGWRGGPIVGWHSSTRAKSITIRDTASARRFVEDNGTNSDDWDIRGGSISIDDTWEGWDKFDVESHWAGEVKAWKEATNAS